MVATPKEVKVLNTGWVNCTSCEREVSHYENDNVYIVDSRNGKLCPRCALMRLDGKIELLQAQIIKLEKFKKKIATKVILNQIEVDNEDGRTNS